VIEFCWGEVANKNREDEVTKNELCDQDWLMILVAAVGRIRKKSRLTKDK